MRLLALLDAKNYDPDLPRLVREAVRGIIVRDGKLIMVRSEKYGEYKFPGGGMEPGETMLETLIREVREETGFQVLPGSMREYGMTKELRPDRDGAAVFEQSSYYFTCEVGEELSETEPDDYEAEYGYRMELVSAREALAANRALADKQQPLWTAREILVLEELCREDAIKV